MKKEFNRAKIEANMHQSKKDARLILEKEPRNGGVNSDMIFKALHGNNKILYNVPCGFDEEQLRLLLPEEMTSYQRWKMMHMEYTSHNCDVNFQTQTSIEEDNEDLSFTGGHLDDRLAQFDVRTEMMEKEWYTKFSDVRRGSFLSKNLKLEDRLWNKARKERLRKRGRRSLDVTWESLPASHVQFLHWIGF